MPDSYVISASVADVRRDPDPQSELVTQALLNRPAIAGASRNGWTFVTLSDYAGWVRSDDLDEPVCKGFTRVGKCCGTALDLVAVVNAPYVPLYAESQENEILDTLYLSTVLPLLDITHPARLHVALPGEREGWLDRRASLLSRQSNPYPQLPISAIIAYAHTFLGVPYLWGGTSWRGIDCSGFVQLCYRMGDTTLPRDAHQQHDALPQTIERTDMQAGDLIFFGRQSITHVALAISPTAYIHAEGQRFNCVTINSFDPAHPRYDQYLLDLVWGLKRVITEGAA